MKYRLKVKMSKVRWKLGIIIYDSYENAKARQDELRSIGITSIIVDDLGGVL